MNMTRFERLWGGVYGLFQIFVLSPLLLFASIHLFHRLDECAINITFFIINFVMIWSICHRFLWKELKHACSQPRKTLSYAFFGFLAHCICNVFINLAFALLNPDFANVNDANISELVAQAPTAMILCTVIPVPVVEETVYRGVVFGGLRKKSRVLAYIVSALAFSAIHVVGYIGMYDPTTLLLCLLEYIPISLILAWSYEKSQTIWCPILIHMTVNQMGMLLMR